MRCTALEIQRSVHSGGCLCWCHNESSSSGPYANINLWLWQPCYFILLLLERLDVLVKNMWQLQWQLQCNNQLTATILFSRSCRTSSSTFFPSSVVTSITFPSTCRWWENRWRTTKVWLKRTAPYWTKNVYLAQTEHCLWSAQYNFFRWPFPKDSHFLFINLTFDSKLNIL